MNREVRSTRALVGLVALGLAAAACAGGRAQTAAGPAVAPSTVPPEAVAAADIVGRDLPESLLGEYVVIGEPHTLTLRPASDPICNEIPGVDGSCYTILKPGDPGARGAALVDGDLLVLGFTKVPFDRKCEGTTHSYTIGSSAHLAFAAEDVATCGFRDGFERMT